MKPFLYPLFAICLISPLVAGDNPPTLNRRDLPAAKAAAEEAAFRSPEIQALTTNPTTTWAQLKVAVEKKALEVNPALQTIHTNPIDCLSAEEKLAYQAALTKANQSPTVNALRNQIQIIQTTIDTLTEELSPGYKTLQAKLVKALQN